MKNYLAIRFFNKINFFFFFIIFVFIFTAIFNINSNLNSVKNELISQNQILKNIIQTKIDFIKQDLKFYPRSVDQELYLKNLLYKYPFIDEIYLSDDNLISTKIYSKNKIKLKQISINNFQEKMKNKDFLFLSFSYPKIPKNTKLLFSYKFDGEYINLITNANNFIQNENDNIIIYDKLNNIFKNKQKISDVFKLSEILDNKLNLAKNNEKDIFQFFIKTSINEGEINIISTYNFYDFLINSLVFLLILIALFGFVIYQNFKLKIFAKNKIFTPLEKIKIIMSKNNAIKENTTNETINIYNGLSNIFAKMNLLELNSAYYKDFYKLIFNESKLKIIAINAKNSSIIGASKAALEFYKYNNQEILERNLFDIFSNDLDEFFIYSTKINPKNSNLAFSSKTKNGEIKFVQISIDYINLNQNDYYFILIWDITDSRLKYLNMKKTQNQLNYSPIVYVNFEAKNFIIKALSPNAKRILNLNVEEILIKNKKFDFRELIYKDDLYKFTNEINKNINYIWEDETLAFEQILRLNIKGNIVWFKFFINLKLYNNKPVVNLFLLNYSKIKKELDENIIKLKEYQNILNLNIDATWQFNIKNQEFKFSPTFPDILGFNINEMKPSFNHKELCTMMDDNDAMNLIMEIYEILENHKKSFSIRMKLIDKFKNPMHVIFNGVGIYAKDKLVAIGGTIKDIENNFKKENKLQTILNTFQRAKAGMAITDEKGDIIEVNDSFSNITGYSKKELISKNPRLLKSHKQNKEFYEKMWSDLKENNFWSGYIVDKRKTGELYKKFLSISKIILDDGTINYLSIFTDLNQTFQDK